MEARTVGHGFLSWRCWTQNFIAENRSKIRDLLGPERFYICLYVLGLLSRQWAAEAVGEEDFWSGLSR